MSLLYDMLYPSSFKGAGFFYIDGSENGGRKTVIHEYPNKNTRYVEDLGLNQRTFNLTARVKGLFYLDDRKSLIDALNTAGPGIFTHPFLGNINCVCVGYTVPEAISSLGIADININLVESKPSQFPNADDNVLAKLADIYRKAYDFIKNDLNGQYVAKYINNIVSAAEKLKDMISQMKLIAATISSFSDNNKDFKSQVVDIYQNAYKIASPNGDIGGNVSDSVELFDRLSAIGQTRFNASNSLFGFGFNDVVSTFNTLKSKQKNTNQKTINGSINTLALINMIDSSKNIDYTDENILDNTANEIDVNYDALINNSNVILTNDARDLIDEARNYSRIFFQQKRLVVNKIINIETKEMPATILCYQYYGKLDNYDEILSLNNIFNPAVISGDLKIVEST